MTGLPCAEADWPRFSALLEDGLDLPDGAQAAWLAALGPDDAHLRAALARVLGRASLHDTAEFLRLPDWHATGCVPGDRIGPYVLQSLLGRGGMGEVWRARRGEDGPRREVALKLQSPAFAGAADQRRFARERDVLAALSHPNIAQLYDAGVTEAGRPYLVLELVSGTPITEFCRAEKTPLVQRIDLAIQILDGLSYAHRRLVVHRDIKPSNVLVTAAGQIKLLDFGIAKLLGPEEDPLAALTQAGRPATPGYAAPEQLGFAPITVATDVFGAANLAFEVCTGHLPFARGGPAGKAAPLASSRADGAAAGAPEDSRLARQLRGDLDAILAKALTIEPAGRYPSAEAFAADLRRWRRGLPIMARRIDLPARIVKFCRRNPMAVGLGAMLALSVAGGMTGVAWQARRAEREAARQAEAARRATAVTDFLIGLFRQIDPRGGGTPGHEMTARDLLDIGAGRAAAAFRRDPLTAISLLEPLASIYDALDDFPRAKALWAQRLDFERAAFGESDWRYLESALDFAASLSEAKDYAAAQAILGRIGPVIARTFGADGAQYAYWLTERAKSLRAAPDGRAEAVAGLERAVAIFSARRLDTGQADEFVDALLLLSFRQFDADRFALSLATLRRMRAQSQKVLPGDAIHDIAYRDAEGVRLERLGDLAGAEADFVAEAARAERVLGREHYWFRGALAKQIMLAALNGDRAKAEALFRRAPTRSPDAPDSISRAHAAALVTEGNGAAAIPVLEAFVSKSMTANRDAADLLRAESWLGRAYAQAGARDQARHWLRQARDDWRRFGVPGQASSLAAQQYWAAFLLDTGDRAAAKAEFSDVLARSRGVPMEPAARAAGGLAMAALAEGDIARADAASGAALATLAATSGEVDAGARVELWLTRAETLLALGRMATARDLATRAAEAADRHFAPGAAVLLRAHTLLDRTGAPR